MRSVALSAAGSKQWLRIKGTRVRIWKSVLQSLFSLEHGNQLKGHLVLLEMYDFRIFVDISEDILNGPLKLLHGAASICFSPWNPSMRDSIDVMIDCISHD